MYGDRREIRAAAARIPSEGMAGVAAARRTADRSRTRTTQGDTLSCTFDESEEKSDPAMPYHAQHSEDLYFQMYGLTAHAPEALNDALRRAIETMHRTLYAPSRDELTPPELALLHRAGVDVEEHPDHHDPMVTYATEYGAILATSLSAAQAGGRLGGVTAVRIRQMIRERSLYALRLEGRWKIPIFQFHDEGLVPNIAVVNSVLPRTLDPVSVLRWYTSPDPELKATGGNVLSPLDWLRAGMNPAPVVAIARDL